MPSLSARLWGPSGSPLQRIKLRAIDAVFENGRIQSFADVGGVWAVEGGYTFYALEQNYVERAVLIDEEIGETTRKRAKQFPQLELIQARFADSAALDRVREIEAVLLFDVLLHQVAPDWDEVLRRYAEHAEYVIVIQPTYVAGDEAVRLLDLGKERYLEIVPDVPRHHEVWTKMNEYVPERGRVYRDIHDIWQWGITDRDLTRVAKEVGLDVIYYENGGTWRGQPAFERHAFIFRRR